MPKEKLPPFLRRAQDFYGNLFDVRSETKLIEAMDDWEDASPDSHEFAVAHLLYLNLAAELRTQRILMRMLDELEALNTNLEGEEDAEDEDEDDLAHEEELADDDEPDDDGRDFDDDLLEEDDEAPEGEPQVIEVDASPANDDEPDEDLLAPEREESEDEEGR